VRKDKVCPPSLRKSSDDVVTKCISKLHYGTQQGANLGLKCARMRLAAGLRPDPLRELERSPLPLSCNLGCLLLREEGKGKREGRGWEKGREEGQGRKG